jgi:hypothetical protein
LAVTLAALIVASLAVLRPFEDAIHGAGDRMRNAAARASDEESALAERERIAAGAARIRADLRGLTLHTPPGAQATGLLADLQRLAEQDGVRIIAIRPQPAVPAAQPGATAGDGASRLLAAAGTPGESSADFELRLSGEFRPIVAMIRGLSLMPIPARVLDLRLERNPAASSRTEEIEATVRLAAVRFQPDRTPPP